MSVTSLIISRIFAIFLVISVVVLQFALPPQAAAQTLPWGGGCVYLAEGDTEAPVATIQGLECLIANIFIVFITIIGLAGFVMFIVASFRWMTSGGNTKGVETARNTFTFVVIGIIVALSAYIIINLIAAFTGINIIREFRVPNSNDEYVVPTTP
jgi:hypothetical protein